ncbi:hypothetical protein [Inquilinus sp. OTU3971]|uniref:hypothetical protein n=1 Tax=Inquilinus sp. OTU3971 TaxID=3043855 RepID=UPI00313F112D
MAIVDGTAGNDLIHVAGDGMIAPPGYTDIAQTTAFNDTVRGLGGIDLIIGGGGLDLLDGGDGNDVLVGGVGADTLIGGAGIDTVRYDGPEAVSIDLGATFTGNGGGNEPGRPALLYAAASALRIARKASSAAMSCFSPATSAARRSYSPAMPS